MKPKLHTSLLTIILLAFSQLVLGNSFLSAANNFNNEATASFWSKHEANWKQIENFNNDPFWISSKKSSNATTASYANETIPSGSLVIAMVYYTDIG
jgi:hypothetical protein